MFRLSDGEEIMTVAFFVLIQYRSVTDLQTDGRTDGQTDRHLCSGYTSACIACYANALVKMTLRRCMLHVQGVATVSRIFHWASPPFRSPSYPLPFRVTKRPLKYSCNSLIYTWCTS